MMNRYTKLGWKSIEKEEKLKRRTKQWNCRVEFRAHSGAGVSCMAGPPAGQGNKPFNPPWSDTDSFQEHPPFNEKGGQATCTSTSVFTTWSSDRLGFLPLWMSALKTICCILCVTITQPPVPLNQLSIGLIQPCKCPLSTIQAQQHCHTATPSHRQRSVRKSHRVVTDWP